MRSEPLQPREPEQRNLPEAGADDEQRTEDQDRDEHDDGSDVAEERVERSAEQRAEQPTGFFQRAHRVAAGAPVPDVEEADGGGAHEREADARAECRFVSAPSRRG